MSLFQIHSLSRPGLQPVTLSLAAGECLGISGPSGAGKSLLLRSLADLDPHQGSMLLDGSDSQSLSPCQWRRQVMLLPAESQWWLERMGDHFAGFTMDAGLLDSLGLTGAMLAQPVARLSTGERQRFAILRLLLHRPRVLLLDEPTASLDPARVERVEALLTGYCRDHGAAMIWVGHDPQQLQRMASQQCVMRDGVLECDS
ncbi:MAG: ABC transporter ATP-binding protein [Gammaproteobacteria bacterium]|nr:ABC transporter ATP-binding protein [Gammaproteobacteria bacterium]